MKAVINGRWEEVAASTRAGGGMTALPVARGVFETLLVREGRPVFFEEHWARFVDGLRAAGLEAPVTAAAMETMARELAAENGIGEGVLRFAAWADAAGMPGGWRVEVSPPRAHAARREFRVAIGPVVPVDARESAWKHLRRTAWTEALKAARAAGWDEAVVFDAAGQVIEACVSNVFFVRGGRLHTPGLGCGPLPGVIRAKVLAVARENGMEVEEGVYARSDPEQADEIWLSNSLLGLRPVAELGERRLSASRPVLGRLRAAWRDRYGWEPVIVVGEA